MCAALALFLLNNLFLLTNLKHDTEKWWWGIEYFPIDTKLWGSWRPPCVYLLHRSIPRQVGGAGVNEAVSVSSAVHVAIAVPMSSNPESQEYVAVSEVIDEIPVVVTPPLRGSEGLGHMAREIDHRRSAH